MKLDELLHQTSEWLRGTGPNSNIIISSRVRLARNLNKLPFSHWAAKKQQEDTLKLIEPVMLSLNYFKDGIYLLMNKLNSIDRQFLLERHLVSREHIVQTDVKAVCIDKNEIISVMVNEEDHMRSQVIQSGFNLRSAWDVINNLDKEMERRLNFAFSVDWGYLTACPTNTGTGMRASVMLHLPSLVMTKQINRVLQAIAKLGLTARGLFGEGTEASGNFFQISNSVTMGRSEESILDSIERIIRQIIDYEQNARAALLKQNRAGIEDQIWRGFGILKSAHIISSKETIELLSIVRLGVDLEIIKEIDRQTVNQLFILTQPAHLQKLEGKILTQQERDVTRARLIREKLTGK
ncbi:MAG: protein arginine kinase [Candidatus Omnitrophota bacterium]